MARNMSQSLLPLLPPCLRVMSVGIGVTSSILPIFIPIYMLINIHRASLIYKHKHRTPQNIELVYKKLHTKSS